MSETCEVISSDMNDKTFTLTLMTSLDPDEDVPFEIDLCVGSNTQWNFLKYAFILPLVFTSINVQ